jgi:hypothetical protein
VAGGTALSRVGMINLQAVARHRRPSAGQPTQREGHVAGWEGISAATKLLQLVRDRNSTNRPPTVAQIYEGAT